MSSLSIRINNLILYLIIILILCLEILKTIEGLSVKIRFTRQCCAYSSHSDYKPYHIIGISGKND